MDRATTTAILVDHFKNPRCMGPLEEADVSMPGGNPGCGDVIVVHVKADPAGEKIEAASFEGSGCTISQAAMLKACQQPLPEEHDRRMSAFTERRNYLVEAVNELPGVSLAAPRGSFYALMDIRPICEARGIDDVAACKQLLEQHYLALVPGSAFGAPGFIRASFAAGMETLQKAVARLAAWAAEK